MIRRAFVTGGRGFVGAWLVNELLNHGYHVVSLVRDNVGGREPIRRELIEVSGDTRDVDLLFRILTDYDITFVFHLAAQAYVTKALINPFETWDSNVRGTYALLDICRRYRELQGVYIMSSDKAYGSSPAPYREDTPLTGTYPYDATKYVTEIAARSYAATYGLPVVIGRPSNIYGPGDLHPTRLIPGTILSVLEGEPPIIRSDGLPSRDYLYVTDIVRGIRILGEKAQEFAGEAFNFGTGIPIRVLDLVNKILKLMNSNLEPNVQGTARAELDIQYIDATKAQRLLGWSPRVSLDDGLRETIAWWADGRPLQ